ncbi:peptidoglycan-binding protein [Tolypothrix sp. FACHB-123]|uniref:peptidoglycan-binding domain-containing protein n=1 Tax=Tolypothrix sp. FACHB-123 TaxID=2692868 RepID=UPI0016880DBC|nr:peptidoglycan-binding domain-containing protein [Tolypothrix sp. FACHB-123]MBD2359514.1 peptidoglycan-binding protein [Tolypothrix sp. FACHB-123]
MRKNFLFTLIFSLAVVLSLLTSNAVVSLNQQELPSALIAAIRQDFWQYRENFSDYYKDSKDHRVFFVDLNNDRVKEAILYPIGGIICSNRSCPIFIYTKVGNKYRKISAHETDRYSAVAGLRNEPSIGVLTTSNQGWRDIATRFFDYTTRTEKWSRVRYGSHGYTDSPLILASTPRTILEYSSGVKTDFKKFLANDTALAVYSRCKYVTKQAPTPYCFKQGNSGRLINVLVEDLRKAGYYQYPTTNLFDSKVEASVLKFQKDYRTIKGSEFASVLKADGVVGEDTLIRLCQAVGRGCSAESDFSCYTGSPIRVIECLNKYKE